MKDVLITGIALCGVGGVLYAVWAFGGWAVLAGIGGLGALIYSWLLHLGKRGDDG